MFYIYIDTHTHIYMCVYMYVCGDGVSVRFYMKNPKLKIAIINLEYPILC